MGETELDLQGKADLAQVGEEKKTHIKGRKGAEGALCPMGLAPVRIAQRWMENPEEGP